MLILGGLNVCQMLVKRHWTLFTGNVQRTIVWIAIGNSSISLLLAFINSTQCI